MLPRRLRVNKAQKFSRVYKAGKQIRTDRLRFFFLLTDQNPTRFGFVISKKQIKTIAERNRVKRILRDEVHKVASQVVPGYEVVVQVRTGLNNHLPGAILRQELQTALRKMRLL